MIAIPGRRLSKLPAMAIGICAMIVAGSAPIVAQKSTQDIYLDKCSVCHGPDGAAKTAKGKKLKVKDVRETAGKMTAEDMIVVVTKGKGDDMDAFAKEFSADQIKQLVEYYRGLAKK